MKKPPIRWFFVANDNQKTFTSAIKINIICLGVIMKKEQLIFDQRYVGSLSLRHVSKFYGENNEIKALDNVSLQLFTGQFVVILGASGSGKSTLLNIIGGMDSVSQGNVNFAGVDITTLSEKMFASYRHEVVGFIFQFYNLMPNLTALENVEIAELPGQMLAIDALKAVGLEDRQYNFPSEMSGGEQQRWIILKKQGNKMPSFASGSLWQRKRSTQETRNEPLSTPCEPTRKPSAPHSSAV